MTGKRTTLLVATALLIRAGPGPIAHADDPNPPDLARLHDVVPSLRRLWSISVMIAVRDRPFPFGAGRIGWRNLVATTTSSRSA